MCRYSHQMGSCHQPPGPFILISTCCHVLRKESYQKTFKQPSFLLFTQGLFPYYIISYNKQGSFQMIIEDYNKGPRVVRKDYVLQKIKNLQESASMPASSGQSQFSIRSLVALKLKLKNYVCGQSPIDFENILEETYLPISTYIYISFLPKQTLFQRCS